MLSFKLQAQVILVPSKDMALDPYLQKCKVEGYQCTQDYFKKNMANTKSEKFEQFIETLDLNSEDYRKTLIIKVKNLLTQENLNLDQVNLLIKVITRFETIDRNVILSQIKNELKELSLDVQILFEEKSEAETYVLFNKFLTKKQYMALKYKQKYTRTMKITPFAEPTNALELRANDLIQGNCESYTPSFLLTNLKYTIVFANECENSQAYTAQTSTSEFRWKDYEKPLMYTAALALAIGLLSQYQVEITY
ncbi:MAG: hypothetical protein H7235_02205 [Bdellovibrionaceae bacterium]|nr:hypothetical protein [Pseudobdellovibrionaceae bacterium]